MAYERRCVVAGRFEAIDHRRRAREQVLDAILAAAAASSARLRSVMSLHEPTTSTGWPSSSRINCCASFTQQ